MVRVCSVCDDGGLCPDGDGCTVTPEFIAEMRACAATLMRVSTLFRYYKPPFSLWSAHTLNYEANYLEANQ